MVTVPVSLADPELRPVWEAVRSRLERTGVDNRGRLRLPPLSPRARHVLDSVAGRRLAATIPLDALEAGLVRLGVGVDLADALAQLGTPVSPAPALRRAARAEAAAGRRLARRVVGEWPEAWASDWLEGVIRAGVLAGMGPDEAAELVTMVRRLLEELPANGEPSVSRVDLAARVAGSAHALDEGTRLAAAFGRALRHLHPDAPDRNLWEHAGVQVDLVSGAALTWGLAARGGTALAPLLAGAVELGVPIHLTQFMLRRHPLQPASGSAVLVVENPRVVEAAAERRHPGAVVAGNGHPSGAVRTLLEQLMEGGAALLYHGDFDPTGLAICGRMHQNGLEPFRMGAADYLAAMESAEAPLPKANRPARPTPWDPDLQAAFNRHRRIVHEELLLDDILR